MVGEPGLFRGAEILSGAAVAEILLVELLVIVRVLVLDAVHGGVQAGQEIRAILVDGEIDVRGPDLADGHGGFGPAEDVHGHKGVEIAPPEQLHGVDFIAGQVDDFSGDAVRPRPVEKHTLLNAPTVDADPLAVQGGVIVG